MTKTLALMLCLGISVPLIAQSSDAGGTQPADNPAATAGATMPTTQPDVAAVSPAPAMANAIAALPAGTEVKMKLETPISTRSNKPGDRFAGRVTADVTLNGRTVIPVGAALEGRIARADERRRIRGKPVIDLRPDTVVMPNGNRYTLNAVVIDTDARPDVDVNDEGKLVGRGHDGRDWKETGIAAGAGALAGGIVAGGHGMLMGAGAGATASVVHWLVKRRSTELPAGTEIIMELSHPVSLAGSTSAGL